MNEFNFNFNGVYSVLYMFTLVNIKEKTRNAVTVSFNTDSCPLGYSVKEFIF